MLSPYWIGMDHPANGTILPEGNGLETGGFMRCAVALPPDSAKIRKIDGSKIDGSKKVAKTKQ
jgi:hypothetical protein